MKYTFEFDTYRMSENYKPGDEVLVYSRHDLNIDKVFYHISKRAALTGMRGNIRNEYRYHGWRGTTDNVSVEAHGVYSVKDVTEKNGITKVKLNRVDLKKNEP